MSKPDVVKLPMPYLYEEANPGKYPVKELFIKKSLHDTYKFDPKHIPIAGGSHIQYMNAENQDYYTATYTRQKVKDPVALVYLLTKSEICNSYSKRRLIEEARRMKIQLEIKQPSKFDLVVACKARSDDTRDVLMYEEKEIPVPDAVMVRLGANIDYFGLAVLRQFASLDVKIFNGVRAMMISRDKLYTAQELSVRGVDLPKSMLSNLPVSTRLIEEHLNGFPVIMKAISGSQGNAVWKFDSPEEMKEKLPEIQKELTDNHVIFQEFIAATRGKDLRVVVVNGKVVGCMMRIAASGFKSNVHQGGAVKKIAIKPDLAAMAIEAAKHCELDIAGIDLLLDASGYRICEVNSSPGFEGLERASEKNIARAMLSGVMDWLNEFKLKKTARRRKKTVRKVSVQQEHRETPGPPADPPKKKQKTEESPAAK